MRRVNWTNVEKSTKDLKRKIKNLKSAGDYLKDRPESGYFKDNISKRIIKLSDAKSSTLRRYIKIVDNYYYLVTSNADRTYLLNKKIEIESELNKREDAVVKKEN
jgi:glucan-binding YG repeat protein